MIDTDINVFFIASQYFHYIWNLQEIDYGLQGADTLPSSSVRQNAKWLKSIDSEGNVAKFQPYVVSAYVPEVIKH